MCRMYSSVVNFNASLNTQFVRLITFYLCLPTVGPYWLSFGAQTSQSALGKKKTFYDLLCHIGKSFGLSICPFHFRMDSPRWTAHNANRAFALRVHNLPILGLAKMQSCREWIRSSGRWSRRKTGSGAQSVDICVKEKVDAISWLAHLNSATLAGENGRCDYCCDLLCVFVSHIFQLLCSFLQYGSASTCFYMLLHASTTTTTTTTTSTTTATTTTATTGSMDLWWFAWSRVFAESFLVFKSWAQTGFLEPLQNNCKTTDLLSINSWHKYFHQLLFDPKKYESL